MFVLTGTFIGLDWFWSSFRAVHLTQILQEHILQLFTLRDSSCFGSRHLVVYARMLNFLGAGYSPIPSQKRDMLLESDLRRRMYGKSDYLDTVVA